MDKIEEKLISCFSAVMPDLTPAEIPRVSAVNTSNWDSVTTVTLMAVIEDEFGIAIEVDDVAHFNSFQGILQHLREGSISEEAAAETERTDAERVEVEGSGIRLDSRARGRG